MKRCRDCGREKARSEFYRDASRRDGIRSSCKECERARNHDWYVANRERSIAAAQAWRQSNPERYEETQARHRARRRSEQRADHLKRTFGLTLDEYDAMLARQEGRCAICRQLPTAGKFLHVDHDHATGEVRGLLCVRCNNALGLFRDRIEVLDRAMEYLALGGSTTPLVDLRDAARVRARELVTAPG
jgi:Autographiviridae endonuclease VII